MEHFLNGPAEEQAGMQGPQAESLNKEQVPLPGAHPMEFPVFTRLEDYQLYKLLNAEQISWRQREEHRLGEDLHPYTGYCAICGKPVTFRATWDYPCVVDGVAYPNFRETLTCGTCGFNFRMRSVVHIMKNLLAPDMRIYMTEQITPLYSLVNKLYPAGVVGSEFLGDAVPLGASKDGIRNEDVTSLTFADGTFDAVCTCDVLEHVFDFRKAFQELARVLKPSGWLILSVPFLHHPNTSVRARLREDGSIEHLLPPEYHADPLNSQGCLCVYHYGWDILQTMKDAGFSWAGVVAYWSKEYGYMGLGEQVLIIARK